MLEYMTIGELAEAAIEANLEANAPPCRMQGHRRASSWVVRAFADDLGAPELTLQSLAKLEDILFRLHDAGRISRSTFMERRRLLADMADLAEYGAVGRAMLPRRGRDGNPLLRPVPDEVKMDDGSVIGLSLAVIDEMVREGYSANYVNWYKMCALPRLIEHFAEAGTDRYSDELIDSFVGKVRDGYCAGRSFYDVLRPAALHVRYMHHEGKLYARGSTLVDEAKSGPFGEIVGEFVEWRERAGAKPSTARSDVRVVVRLLGLLCREGRGGLAGATRASVQSSLAEMLDGKPPCYVRSILTSARAFAAFLAERHPELPAIGGWIGRNPRTVRPRPIEGYTAGQAEAMAASADASSAMGMRDRAILLLMATTGMRACDVAALTLDDIDWRANEIAVRQEKTGVATALPLDVRAGEAIAAYIVGARRGYGGRAVFTTVEGAVRPLKASSLHYVVRKYSAAADEAGFDGVHGTHAFRRGLGAAMVNSGSSLADAADVLGHSRAESAMPYASMATERLRGCSAGLSDMPGGEGGVRDGSEC